MKIYLLLLIFFYLNLFTASAQHEADNWYFGDHAGISFKNGTPVALTDGKLNTLEGCATISDKTTGKLLFYTDGVTVWNNNHQIMTNGTGLMGNYSSTQSALIVPNPANSLQYYIFTTPIYNENSRNLTYSIVSMETSSGVVISKNNFLIDDISEKLTGTICCNTKEFWVITHHTTKNLFYSFHIGVEGIKTIPIISPYVSDIKGFYVGYVKISPDNSKIALASPSSLNGDPIFALALFDFNAKTGEVTNYKRLNETQKSIPFYGVSFSPDNSKLYTSGWSNSIFQYEVKLQDAASIRNSLFEINVGAEFIGALQLAPDGRLYAAQCGITYEGTTFVSVIDNPNLKGSACGYRANAIKVVKKCLSGLPNFMDYIFNESKVEPLSPCALPQVGIQSDSGCVGNTLIFIDKSKSASRRTWAFEGGVPNTSTDSIATVRYSQAGAHTVILTVENNNGSSSDTTIATAYPLPTAKAGADQSICKGESTQLGDKPEPGNKYSWQPTTDLDDATLANPTASPTTNMQYILTVTSEHGCVAYDTVLVTIGTIVAKVSPDTAICSGSSVQLIASGGAEYVWSPSTGLSNSSIENPIATPVITTQYKVIVSSGTCKDSAFVTITVNPQPTADAGPDQTICSGEPVNIGVPAVTGNTYSWQPPTGLSNATISNPTASPTVTTEYILTVTSNGCVAFDTVVVTVGNLTAKVSADVSICAGKTAQLLASGGTKYVWSPSDGLNDTSIPNPIASPSSTTRYKVVVSSGSCIDSAFVTVTIAPPPIADAGNDRVICVGESTQIGTTADPASSYAWSPLTGLLSPFSSQTIASPATTTTYTLTVTNPAGCVNYDTITISVNPLNERSFTLEPDTVIITPGQQFRVNLNVSSGVSDWGVRLGYNPRLVKYNSINNGLQAISDNQKGELLIRGSVGNTTSSITFEAFLPHTSDTIYAVKLSLDTAQATPCETSTAIGNILKLSDYCGKNIRVVSATGKSYFLTVKGNTIDFGVGLSGNVHLEVFDYLGHSMQILNDGNLEAGAYSAEIDLPTGVYFCRMRAGMFEGVGKVVVGF